ncbi:tumor necrosis factor receptor superfamily member 14 isoform X2 [Caloenas nicobarica]|uniref:tumor necrosis factor receptor superfamily member 14 isoform X2 n=1 Tax=Caloenas nicobarica TaxID=187106 RepID=UPI0032B71599
MRLVLAVVLVMQLGSVEALDCGLGEYPVGAECCPMCAAGLRVFKHCTANSSTTCVPCVNDTYTDHPNGLEHCSQCKRCDEGTKTMDNVCEACPPGTSSTADMPYACRPQPKHEESGPGQGEDGNPSSAYFVATIVSAVVIVLLVAAGFACVWQRRKRKRFVPLVQQSGSGQQGQTSMGNVDNRDQTTVPVLESGTGLEEIRLE